MSTHRVAVRNVVDGVPHRAGRVDRMLLGVASVATGFSTVCVAKGIAQELSTDLSRNLGVLWVGLLIPWSFGLVLVAARASMLPVRSTAARTALVLCTSVPVLLMVVNLLIDVEGGPRRSLVPDIVGLARNEAVADRALLGLALIPLLLSWKLLVELPSIRAFGFRRRVAHLALVAPAAPCLAIALSPIADVNGTLWKLGGVVTGLVLLATAAGIVATAAGAEPRLPSELHWLVAVGVPIAQVTGAAITFYVAFRGASLVGLLPAIGYLICLLPIGALGFFAYDYLVVGGSAFVPGLLRAGTDPAAIESVLRTALGDPHLTLAFEREADGTLVDVDGRPVDTSTLPPQRVQWVSLDAEPVAAVIWSRSDDGGPARSSSVFTVAGVVLERARVHAQLHASVVELTESRRRLEHAHNSGRRAVERDLHDGAQQHLLAIRLALRAAARNSTSTETRALAEQIGAEVDTALRLIQDLARGIYPAPLRTGGLPSAIESLSEAVPIVVVRDVAPLRFTEEVEEAVYFFVSEALANVVKHSGATEAVVRISATTHCLRASISDQGTGGVEVRPGSGLSGLADRMAAVDGQVGVRSNTSGTVATVSIPLRNEPRPIAVPDLVRLDAPATIDLSHRRDVHAADGPTDRSAPDPERSLPCTEPQLPPHPSVSSSRTTAPI